MMKSRRGDTIIEVLLAIAVSGIVLAGAYSLATRSLNASRDAQEHVEALQLAESQLEKLKEAAASPLSNIFDTTTPFFCMDTSTPPVKEDEPFNPSFPALDSDDFSKYLAACTPPNNGTTIYNIAIQYQPTVLIPSAPPNPGGTITDVFTVHIRWDRVGGGKNEVTLTYKLHNT